MEFCRRHNCKTDHFTLLIGQERLRNEKWKTLESKAQKCCFSVLNMQICDVLVGVVIVVA